MYQRLCLPGDTTVSRMAGFVAVESAAGRNKARDVLQRSYDRIRNMMKSKQADDDDLVAGRRELARIEKALEHL